MNTNSNNFTPKVIAVSACLLGENCKYNGGNNKNEALLAWLQDKTVIPVCPEVLGGLPTPRPRAEIYEEKVINEYGESVHSAFVNGAKAALRILKEQDVDLVILQPRSPSCGVNHIYDGTFQGNLVKGQGIFCKLLVEAGYQVIDLEDIISRIT